MGNEKQDKPYSGKHRAEAGSDLPPRGENVRDVDTSKRKEKR